MNAQKTPLVSSINAGAKTQAQNAITDLGRALPASVVKVMGAIVEVKFEVNSNFTIPNVTIPLFGPEYIRYPIQPGCKGLVVPSDAYLGGMSGLGGGVADMSLRGNLTALVFFPIGNKGWSSEDPDMLVLYGVKGVVLRDQGKRVTLTLTGSGIAIDLGGGTMTATNGDIIADGVSLKKHTHNQGNDSRGDGEVPTNPPNLTG